MPAFDEAHDALAVVTAGSVASSLDDSGTIEPTNKSRRARGGTGRILRTEILRNDLEIFERAA